MEKVEQLGLQQGVQVVSTTGSVLSTPPVVVSGAGTIVKGRVGTSNGAVKMGQGNFF